VRFIRTATSIEGLSTVRPPDARTPRQSLRRIAIDNTLDAVLAPALRYQARPIATLHFVTRQTRNLDRVATLRAATKTTNGFYASSLFV
jgi:hypothetical protein